MRWALLLVGSLVLASPALGADVLVSVETRSGTAFVVNPNGFLLTNAHVVEGSSRISVTIAGQTWDAAIVALEPDLDLALLKIDAQDLVALPLARSGDLSIGDPVHTVGCPQGICGTTTSGSISNVGIRADRAGPGLLMLDLTTTHGGSGGPLFDAWGRVIGVTTAVLTEGEGKGQTGFSFAVPIDDARRLLQFVPKFVILGPASTEPMLKPAEIRPRVFEGVAFVEAKFEVPLSSLVTATLPSSFSGFSKVVNEAASDPIVHQARGLHASLVSLGLAASSVCTSWQAEAPIESGRLSSPFAGQRVSVSVSKLASSAAAAASGANLRELETKTANAKPATQAFRTSDVFQAGETPIPFVISGGSTFIEDGIAYFVRAIATLSIGQLLVTAYVDAYYLRLATRLPFDFQLPTHLILPNVTSCNCPASSTTWAGSKLTRTTYTCEESPSRTLTPTVVCTPHATTLLSGEEVLESLRLLLNKETEALTKGLTS